MWQIRLHTGALFSFSVPQVVGILNVTPDSFAVHCFELSNDGIELAVREMVDEGVDILDIGGYSTRPGADWVSEEEEWSRVEGALRVIRKNYPDLCISLDTWRSVIARRAVDFYGVDIINDVSGGLWDSGMFEYIAHARVPYILTHTRWLSPLQESGPVSPDDIVSEVLSFMQHRLDLLHQSGASDVILDPGFGLGKSVDENYTLLRDMSVLKFLHCPILVGLSRKSMLYKVLGIEPGAALNATTAAHILALEHGADLLRVHDVRPAKEAIAIYKKTYCID